MLVAIFFAFRIFVDSFVAAQDVNLQPTSVVAFENEKVTFHCTITPQNNWRSTRFDVSFYIDSIVTFINTSGNCLEPGIRNSTLFNVKCGERQGVFLFEILKINEQHNNQYVTCTARYGDGGTGDNIIQRQSNITVLVPISRVSIHPVTSAIRNGSDQTFICTTDAGRPNARIQWYLSDGKNITYLAFQESKCGSTCDKIESTSTLTLTGNLVDHGKAIYCIASNIDGRNVNSQKVIITILYGPSSVTLSPFKPSYTVIENKDTVGPITCTADCRPNCTMAWNGPNLSSDTSVLSLMNISRNQTGRYQCTANNSAGSVTSSPVTVIVNYGPSFVTLSPTTTSYTVTEPTNNVGPITCSADCRPNCTMTWSEPDIPGGTTSVLNLQNITRNQTGIYRCNASNMIGSMTSAPLTVIVYYGPSSVTLSPSTTSYTVSEEKGSVGPITCSADCRPNCTMTWNGPSLSGGKTSVLHLQNITKNQTGNYQCIANNSVDSQPSSNITVIVNFSPIINGIDGNTTYSENDTTMFRCKVDSLPTSTIKWFFKDGNTKTELPNVKKPKINVNDSLLTVSYMNCLSMGLYVCEANNTIGGTNKSLEVRVMCKPRLNTVEYTIKDRIAVKDNEPLNISAPILAYPTPRIYWQFIKNNSRTNITSEIESTYTLNRHFLNLLIENMTQDDFGKYAIYAENGFEIASYIVESARRPTKPSNLTCSTGYNYITVSWKPEFDGGSPQSFRVFYKNVQERKLIRHPEYVSETEYHPIRIANVRSSSVYLLYIYAVNSFNTTVSDEMECNTTAEEASEAESLTAVSIGAGVGSAVVIIIAVLMGLNVYRRLETKTNENDKEPMKRPNEEEGNDDLTVNPLYVSSVDDVVIQKDVNSQVSKENKQGKCTTAKTQKKKKVKDKKSIELGCVYEIHDDFMKENDQVYANRLDRGNISNSYNPTKNKDGLIYADLDFVPVSEQRRFVIHGTDRRNNYAIIDLTKRADPLSSSSEDEEERIENNKGK